MTSEVRWSKTGDWHLYDECKFTAWTSGDIREGKFAYFWAYLVGFEQGPIWYRVYSYRGEAESAEWKPMLSKDRVFSRTGIVDHDPEDNGTVGGAEILPKGMYAIDFKTLVRDTEYTLRGLAIRVAGRDDARGGWNLPDWTF